MDCSRCAKTMLPSVGCTKCSRISDDVLARIARETLPTRTSRRLFGIVAVIVAFILAAGVLGLVFATGVKLMLFAMAIVPIVGSVGARAFDDAKLYNNIDDEKVRRYETERVDAAQTSGGGISAPVGVPAIRVDNEGG